MHYMKSQISLLSSILSIQCPSTKPSISVTFWQIVAKVRVESLLWGVGAALGELPAYFIARAARIAGQEPVDEEYRKFLEMRNANKEKNEEQELSIFERFGSWMEDNIHRFGFPGILLFASIPNPLFEMVGITCGRFLVPFWTFFGAMLIGKALKTHVQAGIVILAFSPYYAETFVKLLEFIQAVGAHFWNPMSDLLEKQRKALHMTPEDHRDPSTMILAIALSAFVTVSIIFIFFFPIVNSLAKNYHKRLWDRKRRQNKVD